MAYQLTDKFKRLLNQGTKAINLIVEIDGIPTIYSSVGVTEAVRIGMAGLKIGNDWVIGGQFQSELNRDVISLQQGTTKTLTQQIQEDKSASSSVKSMNITLVDKDFKVSDDLLSEQYVNELLNRRCNIYLGAVGDTEHPKDSVRIFAGNISDVNLQAGLVGLLVQAPETLKRQTVISQLKTELAAPLLAGEDTISLEDVSGALPRQTGLDCYVRINDEIISFDQVDYANNLLLFCNRGQFGTADVDHEIEDTVESIYSIYGSPLEVVLGLLTGGFKKQIIKSDVDRIENNLIFFVDPNVIDDQGVTLGDQIRAQGTTIGDTGLQTVEDFGMLNGEAYIDVGQDLGVFTATDGQCEFFSKYRLGYGAGIETSQIDVAQFEKIQTLFGSGFPDIEVYLKDDLDLQPFIDEILYSIGAISLERKGRISVTYTAPPLGEVDTKILTSADIVNPDKVKSRKSDNSRFYNVVEFLYDEFILTEDRQRKNIRISAESQDRIEIGNKILRIDARGLRANARDFIEAQSRRFLDRYKFGAETITIDTTFKFGFSIEVGDVVLFAPENLRIWDYTSKSFNFRPRMMEVINKSIDYTTGKTRLVISDTNFGTNIRFSTIGPASYVNTGSTTTLLKLKRLITTPDEFDETYKWENFVGQTIKVRNVDFTQEATVELIRVSPTNPNDIEISTLPFSPSEDMIVELPDYNEATDIQKSLHGFISPTDEIDTVANQKTFDVLDGSKFFDGCLIDIYNEDYSINETRLVVESVTGNTILLTENAETTLVSGLKIGRIGFVSDNGDTYGYY